MSRKLLGERGDDLSRPEEIVLAPRPSRAEQTKFVTSQRTAGSGQPLVLRHPDGAVEAFRLLALTVLQMLERAENRSLVVMSASHLEGRSNTVAGLARAIAEVSGPVVVVSADPTRRSVEELPSEEVDRLWRPGETGSQPPLQVIAPWRRPGVVDPLGSANQFIREAVASGATVIVDAPPAVASSLGFYLATLTAGVLYVMRPNAALARVVHDEIRSQLDLLEVPVLGVVSNEW